MTFSTCDFGAPAWERRNGWLFFWEERHSHSTHAHKGIVMAFFFSFVDDVLRGGGWDGPTATRQEYRRR